ncbi:MAG: acylphosphatase [Calditrichaeota bacterium]|nr:acylphosphatase [Calditrichota bacterium]
MNENKARARVVVHGVVQGVGFRYFAFRNATIRGLRGYVRNLPDGSVETVVEGDREMVEDYVEQVRMGPRFARVTRAEVTWEPYRGEFDSFEIRY